MEYERQVATSNAELRMNAATAASTNPLKSNKMEKIHEETSEELEVTKVEAINASSEQSSNEDMTCCPESRKTVTAIIHGAEQEIILARTIYSMDVLKKNQVKLLEQVDKSKLLDEIFHLSAPDIFYQAGITLYNCEGEEIPVGTENVFVPIETAGTFWSFNFDNVLKHVQIHTFESVEEFAQVTGTTNLFSRGLSTKEKTGLAALATGDETYRAVYELAVRTGMPGSTAEHYLGVQLKSTTTTLMSMGVKSTDVPVLSRSMEEALELHKHVALTFGVAEAKKRYTIRAINSVINVGGYTLEQVLESLKYLPAEDVTRAKLMDCGTKEACIASVLTHFIINMQRDAVSVAA